MAAEIGGPAFPMPAVFGTAQAGSFIQHEEQLGMSLRDYFAAKALPIAFQFYSDGYCGNNGEIDEHAAGVVAKVAYEIADAMLKARAL